VIGESKDSVGGRVLDMGGSTLQHCVSFPRIWDWSLVYRPNNSRPLNLPHELICEDGQIEQYRIYRISEFSTFETLN